MLIAHTLEKEVNEISWHFSWIECKFLRVFPISIYPGFTEEELLLLVQAMEFFKIYFLWVKPHDVPFLQS